MRRGAAILVLLIVASGCKRQKPPARSRIWLGVSQACSLQVEESSGLECWGAQLGALPVAVPGGGRPDEVAIGARHVCSLTKGAVKCWGDNARGQLGKNLETLSGVTAVAAGGDQTCALSASGVRCWGDDRFEPHEVAGLGGRASAIAVGEGYVCAALVEPKAVRCSGAAGAKPMLVGASIAGLTAGPKHACAALEDGSIRCWGANDRGQLGDGTKNDALEPVVVHGLPLASDVHAGAGHTCARLRNSTIACWGENAAHQLVDGTTEPSTKPLPLRGLVGVAELAIGGDSGCARVPKGEVRCWGANTFGQLGDGTTTEHEVPMPVRSPSPGGGAGR